MTGARNAEPNYTLKLTLTEAAEIAKLVAAERDTLERRITLTPDTPEGRAEVKAAQEEYAIIDRLFHRL
jgi:hypothetical protein